MRWSKSRNLIVVLLVIVLVLMSAVGASAGYDGTGVYVNNYELTPAELRSLECLLGDVFPGYYWLDQYGNFGLVGYWSLSINLYDLPAQAFCPLPFGRHGVRPAPRPGPEPQPPLPYIPGIPGPNADGSYGPFATIRRANEVVAKFISMGYPNTIQYHNGDGQYVFPHR